MRTFFALYPDASTRQAIYQLTTRLSTAVGRRTHIDNLHVTLAFLGQINHQTLACVTRAAAKIDGVAIDLAFDTFGYWPRPKVAWLGCTQLPDALVGLADELADVMRACGLQPDSRPYAPHVTLLRKAGRQPDLALDAPISWRAGAFVLMESGSDPERGVRYTVRQTWPLKGL